MMVGVSPAIGENAISLYLRGDRENIDSDQNQGELFGTAGANEKYHFI